MRKLITRRNLAVLKESVKNLKVKYVEVARKLNISHTAVKKHIDNVEKKGLVNFSLLINPFKIGFRLAIILLEVRSLNDIRKLYHRFRNCPRVIYMLRITGDYNVAALVYAEDERVLDSILGTCVLRTAEEIRRSVVYPASETLIGEFLPIEIPEKSFDKAPCGIDCRECERFKYQECIGCPTIKCYRGWFSIEK